MFHINYFNQEYFRVHPAGRMHLDVEDNRAPYRKYFDEILDFCFTSDISKSLGLSFLDIYEKFDIASYMRLREYVTRENQKKLKPMAELQNQMDAKYNKILKGK